MKVFMSAHARVCMYEKKRRKVSYCASILYGVNPLIMHVTYPPFKLQILKSEIWVGLSWKKEQMGLLMWLPEARAEGNEK